jgi:hypothetical protein
MRLMPVLRCLRGMDARTPSDTISGVSSGFPSRTPLPPSPFLESPPEGVDLTTAVFDAKQNGR